MNVRPGHHFWPVEAEISKGMAGFGRGRARYDTIYDVSSSFGEFISIAITIEFCLRLYGD